MDGRAGADGTSGAPRPEPDAPAGPSAPGAAASRAEPAEPAGAVGPPVAPGPGLAGPAVRLAGFGAAVPAATVGSARRCTAGDAGAVVKVAGRAVRTAPDGTGATRGPIGRRTGSEAPAPADAAATPAPEPTGPETPVPEPTAPAPEPTELPVPSREPGSADGCGAATGRVSDGRSSAADGPVDGVSRSLTSPPGPPSRTACDSVPVKDGFCQVVSEALKPGSATWPGVRAADARWIGGSPAQLPGPLPSVACGSAVARAGSSAAGVPTASDAASRGASGRPRSLSRSPISPPSMRV
ncbi:hypothetical protein [Streptomyces pinistramenti]|uniref:hypothetical protein n=1 Tax=Streptomyces pinistramenti TaxID=2884812 RepID=UPI001D078289|nr:hypothetical protein [Streptomyces pinistramenti]MCB5909125.1 hypothetical protein [Streptomyces pinistramenti]